MTCWQFHQRNPDFFGGLNKGRTDAEDLINAEEFARNLKSRNLIAFKQNTPRRKPATSPGLFVERYRFWRRWGKGFLGSTMKEDTGITLYDNTGYCQETLG